MVIKPAKDITAWEKNNIIIPSVSINLSPIQFNDTDLSKKIENAIKAYPLNPLKFEMEITESNSLDDVDKLIERINDIKSIGVGLSIYDFGTGYSSLSYLHKLPVDILKIDKSFIKDIPENQNHVSLTKAIIAIAHELNLKVVAEGIETKEQEEYLKALHCDFGQGYFYSKPLPKDHFEKWFKENMELAGNK
jgi:EAL domain-containing protein (putative c-di-GMP-specific phosphodiesterase class I)